MSNISKRSRFEVFKRDNFRCQYCGRTPPVVILEVDHINPKSKGGISDINNYITACFDCNRGKSNITLDNIPESLQNTITIMKEKREQLKAFSNFLQNIEATTQNDIQTLNQIFESYYNNKSFSDAFTNSTIRTFLRQLPVIKISEAMHKACSRNNSNPNQALLYFCGICWNWIKHPETRDW
jgi:hypothetical protein